MHSATFLALFAFVFACSTVAQVPVGLSVPPCGEHSTQLSFTCPDGAYDKGSEPLSGATLHNIVSGCYNSYEGLTCTYADGDPLSQFCEFDTAGTLVNATLACPPQAQYSEVDGNNCWAYC